MLQGGPKRSLNGLCDYHDHVHAMPVAGIEHHFQSMEMNCMD